MSTVGTEDMDGPPFFRDKDVKGLSLFLPNEDALFVELNPHSYLETMRKQDYTQRGYGDISFNLAVASNVKGIFVCRGLCNKSPSHKNKDLNASHVSVLCLLGNKEPPTDLLLQNLTSCRELILSKWHDAEHVNSSLPFDFNWDVAPEKETFRNQLPTAFTQESGVHVHELIETLAYWGYYKGRNDGVYGPVCRNSVMLLQADLKDSKLYHKRVDGNYGRYTREAFSLFLKQL
jgi:hypothetical protein